MSLLMQALKNAEHAKQKQSGGPADNAPAEKDSPKPPDELFSLSPQETPAESVAISDIAIGMPDAQGHFNSEPLISPLTLSPYAEEKTNESALAEAALTPAASALLELHLPENIDSHQAAPTINFDAVKVEKEASDEVSHVQKESVARPEPAASGTTRPAALRNGAELKQAAEKAGKIHSAAQLQARSVFSSKMPPPGRRNILIGIVGLIVVVACAGYGYYVWQITNNDNSSSSTIIGAPQTGLPPAPLSTSAAGAEPIAADTSPAQETAGSTPSTSTTLAATSQTVAGAASTTSVSTTSALTAPKFTINPVAVVPDDSRKRTATADTAAGDMEIPRMSAAVAQKTRTAQAPDDNAIQIRRNTSGNQINPALNNAYQYFVSGDAASAKQQYQKVLQQEPANRDALLGMAAIALNQRQSDQAGSFYGKLLELDPTDPEAIAGLTSLQQGDPAQSESRLKKVLNQNPQAGSVLFALGNLYAQQSRWSDAQQTYFRAYTSAPTNADYAFNLAVSLDRLNQARLAQEYYQRALVLGQTGPGNFSRSSVQKRIKELADSGAD